MFVCLFGGYNDMSCAHMSPEWVRAKKKYEQVKMISLARAMLSAGTFLMEIRYCVLLAVWRAIMLVFVPAQTICVVKKNHRGHFFVFCLFKLPYVSSGGPSPNGALGE